MTEGAHDRGYMRKSRMLAVEEFNRRRRSSFMMRGIRVYPGLTPAKIDIDFENWSNRRTMSSRLPQKEIREPDGGKFHDRKRPRRIH